MKQYNQELCISLNSRCFTKRLQSRPLNWKQICSNRASKCNEYEFGETSCLILASYIQENCKNRSKLWCFYFASDLRVCNIKHKDHWHLQIRWIKSTQVSSTAIIVPLNSRRNPLISNFPCCVRNGTLRITPDIPKQRPHPESKWGFQHRFTWTGHRRTGFATADRRGRFLRWAPRLLTGK